MSLDAIMPVQLYHDKWWSNASPMHQGYQTRQPWAQIYAVFPFSIRESRKLCEPSSVALQLRRFLFGGPLHWFAPTHTRGNRAYTPLQQRPEEGVAVDPRTIVLVELAATETIMPLPIGYRMVGARSDWLQRK